MMLVNEEIADVFEYRNRLRSRLLRHLLGAAFVNFINTVALNSRDHTLVAVPPTYLQRHPVRRRPSCQHRLSVRAGHVAATADDLRGLFWHRPSEQRYFSTDALGVGSIPLEPYGDAPGSGVVAEKHGGSVKVVHNQVQIPILIEISHRHPRMRTAVV